MTPPTPYTLGIETSGATGTVALYAGERLISQRESAVRNAHGEALLPLIAALLEEANISLAEVSGMAVGVGPGSFTGIRVALGTALGIRIATHLPIVAVDAFDATEEANEGDDDVWLMGRPAAVVVTVLDALRGEAFVRLRRIGAPLAADTSQELGAPRTATPGEVADLVARLALPAVVVGPLAAPVVEALRARGVDATAKGERSADAAAVARCARGRATTDAPEPLYVRPPDISKPKAPPHRTAPPPTDAASVK